MVRSVCQVMLLGVFVSTVACSKKTPEPSAQIAQRQDLPAATAAKAAVANDNNNKLDPNDPKHGTRKLMGLDAPVYVDGAQVAVFRFGEMPNIPNVEGTKRYLISDYLAGIGVDVNQIKSVHFHGNNDRIASIEGSELRKEKGRFQFSFISGDTGTPIQKWDTDHLKNEFVIHEIRRVTVFVKKAPTAIHPQKQCHVGADGDCSDAIPYATGEVAKGTRVYLDGKMVGFVKRRQVTDAMLVSTGAEPSDNQYSVAKLIAGMGVDPASIKSVELMAGDDVVARATGEQFTALAPKTSFTLPKHNHGKVRVHVPAELQAQAPGVTDRDALVSAVILHKNTTSANRDLVAISEDTDLSVQLAAIDDARGKLGRGEQ